MTDEDIIKSLECCSDIGRCCECPMWEMLSANCIVELNRLALEIIKRQQAEQPSDDVAPVRHGEWVEEDTAITCPICTRSYDTDFEIKRSVVLRFKYCPECGAKMDGDKNG